MVKSRKPSAPPGFICEIFSSAQGEGPLLGCRQIFVRLAGCSRRCRFCDTPAGLDARPKSASIETGPGSGVRRKARNPMSPSRVAEAVLALEAFKGMHHSVSLTGGEPLLQPDFLDPLLSLLAGNGFRTFLETNSDFPEAMAWLSRRVDIVSADIKLPSATGEPLDWGRAGRFLKAASGRELIVKMVVAEGTQDAELDRAFGLIASGSPSAIAVVQPVTRVADGPGPPPPSRLLEIQARGLALVRDVRIIPQTHKIAGVP